jgi:predicted small lipoprotein YifL
MKKTLKIVALSLVLVTLVAALASCGGPASTPDKALSALKENGYTAKKDTDIVPIALRLLGVNSIDAVVSGSTTIDGKVETVTIIYFEDKSAASDAWEKVQEYADGKKDSADDSDWVCKKSGAMIYFGTKAGVKAAG